MKALDYLKALGVALEVIIITMAASYLMVAFYAYFIEPGQPQEFYNAAALWIAPWSSYILGPLVFFAFNYRLARRSPARNALGFAAATIGMYIVVDFSMVPAMGLPLSSLVTFSVAFWLLVKLAAALAGARMGYAKA